MFAFLVLLLLLFVLPFMFASELKPETKEEGHIKQKGYKHKQATHNKANKQKSSCVPFLRCSSFHVFVSFLVLLSHSCVFSMLKKRKRTRERTRT